MLMMVDYVREVTVEKSSMYSEYGSLHLLFLYASMFNMFMVQIWKEIDRFDFVLLDIGFVLYG